MSDLSHYGRACSGYMTLTNLNKDPKRKCVFLIASPSRGGKGETLRLVHTCMRIRKVEINLQYACFLIVLSWFVIQGTWQKGENILLSVELYVLICVSCFVRELR